MKKINSAGAVVINPDGMVLVVTNETGTITFPKGRIEVGEAPRTAARREVKEETSIDDLVFHSKLGVVVRQGYTAENMTIPSVIKHIHMYLSSTQQKHAVAQSDDVVEVKWVKPKDLAKSMTYKEDKEFVNKHLGKILKHS